MFSALAIAINCAGRSDDDNDGNIKKRLRPATTRNYGELDGVADEQLFCDHCGLEFTDGCKGNFFIMINIKPLSSCDWI